MPKYLKIILEKMCEVVGTSVTKIKFSEPDWYLKHSWSEDEEKDFKKWMVDYLKDNKEARLELMQFPSKRKKDLEKVVGEFVFNYGWKVKEYLTSRI